MRDALILGVDGGGTKTIAWLAPLEDPSGTVVLGRGQAGPGNPRAAGFETAEANIAAAIAAAFDDARLPQSPVEAACFGLAGAGRAAEQARLSAWAVQRGLARAVRVVGDAEIVLAAASGDRRGIVLICGTGSLAWGRDAAGTTARAGGWGYLIGDEGSAYRIALAGLQAAVQAADGRGQPTALLGHLMRSLDAPTPEALVERIYAPEMTRERLARLCQTVFDAAPADATARAIVAAASRDLASMVATLCRRLQFASGQFPLALAGSVILSQPLLRELLGEQLAEAAALPQSTTLVTDPVRGALGVARTEARSGMSDEG